MAFDSLPYLDNVRMVRLFGRKNEDKIALKDRLSKMSSLSSEFLVLLSVSTVIATFGLFQNSAAVIIGAMIVAPLMKPLMGLAYGSLLANWTLVRKALYSVILGTLLSVIISFVMARILYTIDITQEIASRTHPNLLDLGVAFSAGAAGAYCQTKEQLSDTLAGVAIAVALVPPIGVIGIGLALNQGGIWQGACLLYATNLVGITFAGIIVFLLMGYGPVKRAKDSIIFSLVLVVTLAVPLALSMRELVLESVLARQIRVLLQDETYTFRGVQLQKVEVKRFQSPISVTATVLASGKQITAKQVQAVQDFLTKKTGSPIEFRLQVIPATVVTAIEVTSTGQSKRQVPLGSPLDSKQLEWGLETNADKTRGDASSPEHSTESLNAENEGNPEHSPSSSEETWEQLFSEVIRAPESKVPIHSPTASPAEQTLPSVDSTPSTPPNKGGTTSQKSASPLQHENKSSPEARSKGSRLQKNSIERALHNSLK